MSWRDTMKHTFAVESSDGPPEPTPEQRDVIDRWCRALVSRRLYSPAFRIIGEELTQPLNYVTSQAMHFFRPALRAVATDRFVDDYSQLAGFLEHRGSTSYIAARLAAIEAGKGVGDPAATDPDSHSDFNSDPDSDAGSQPPTDSHPPTQA